MLLFSTDNWHPAPTDYPSLYLVDKEWYLWSATPTPTFGPFSYTRPAIDRNIVSVRQYAREFHSEKTLAVLKEIVPDFPPGKMTLISANRINQSPMFPWRTNIPEAIESIRFMTPPPGSVVMVNLSPVHGSSVLTDKYIGQQLVKLTASGCVVIVSAGNELQLLSADSIPSGNQVVVVGGYSAQSNTPESNYGPGVTSYMPVPISLTRYDVAMTYGQSSAATAQMAGVVLLMQNYAHSRSRFLTPSEVKSILSTRGKPISIQRDRQTVNSFTPVWSALRVGIDAKLTPPVSPIGRIPNMPPGN
ncbi:S8 family serine peptidase [Spirosoma foliorum]|uniref:Peptidase S8/S53 domain-containing protein n=1 Tax=Spirosoma foliorum TaxID=2710596 RepID=A0A7G5GS97_9BACT|nr:S8 family serine peptidase [Spirosoma foliorum]QMW01739.1 hypothetical protein H3H32_27900 [Spirosoma foliorum]